MPDPVPQPSPTLGKQPWRERVVAELAGRAFDRELVHETAEGLRIQPLYTAEDVPDDRELPALPPYRRHGGPLGRGALNCPGVADVDPALAAVRMAEELVGGADGVWLQLDRSARLGRTVNDPGGVGVALRDRAQLAALLHQAAGDARPWLLLDAGANALPVAALLHALAQDQPPRRGLLLCDPLGALARDGELPAPLTALAGEMCQLVDRCRGSDAPLRAIAVSSAPYHDAGAGPALEIGIAAATLIQYLRYLEPVGALAAAEQTAISMPIGRDLFIEVAKLRAMRLVWSKVLAASAVNPLPKPLIHAFSSQRMLSRRDPHVNALRITHAMIAALLGGADLITTGCFDQALGLADAASRRLARNTPLILMRECGLGDVLDPAGGAWYVDALTDQLARRGWQVMQHIERAGGMQPALLSGLVRQMVDEAHASQAERIARRKEPLVGVSRYAQVDEVVPLCESAGAPVEPDPTVSPVASPGVIAGPSAVSFDELIAAAAHTDLFGLGRLLRGEAAMGERIDAFPLRREAAPFESLVEASAALRERGVDTRVFLAALGPPGERQARQDFVVDLLAAGGFATCGADDPAGSDEEAVARVARWFSASGAQAACIVAADERVALQGAALAAALKRHGARAVLCAGRPGAAEAALRAGGVDGFVFIGADVPAVLGSLVAALSAGDAGRKS